MKRDPLDRYCTEDEVAFQCLTPIDVRGASVLDPSAGGGSFLRAAQRHGAKALTGIDVDPHAPGRAEFPWQVADFLHTDPFFTVDCIVGNPPYRHAEEFVTHSRRWARHRPGIPSKVAFLLRLGFLAGQERRAFWNYNPPDQVIVLSEQPSFTGDGGTGATEYAWFIWNSPGRQRWWF